MFRDDAHLSAKDLLQRLHDVEDGPWAEWYGSPLSGRGLANPLEPYRVTPLLRRVHGTPSRGYFRSEFEDSWLRYLPAQSSPPDVIDDQDDRQSALRTVTGVTTVTPVPWHPADEEPDPATPWAEVMT